MRDLTRSRRLAALAGLAGLAGLALAVGVAPVPAGAATGAAGLSEIRVVSAAEAQISSIKAQRASGDTRTVDGTTAYDRVDAVDIGAAEAASAAAAVAPEPGLVLHRRIVVRLGAGYGVKDLYVGAVAGRGAAVLHDVTPSAAGTLVATRLYRVEGERVDDATIATTVTGFDGRRSTLRAPAGPDTQCGSYSADVCEIVIPILRFTRDQICDELERRFPTGDRWTGTCRDLDRVTTEAENEECTVAPGDPYECEYGKAFIDLYGCNSGASCSASGHGVTGAASNRVDFADLYGYWYYPCLSDPERLCTAFSADPMYDVQVTDPGGLFTFSGAVFTDYDRAVCESQTVELQVVFGWTDLSGQVNPPSHQFTTRSESVWVPRVPPVSDPSCA